MKRMTTNLILLLLSAFAVGTALGQENIRGEVLDVDVPESTITVRTEEGIGTYDIDADTDITFRGVRGSGLEDINRGDRVILDFEEATDGRRRARGIRDDDGLTNPGAGSATPPDIDGDARTDTRARRDQIGRADDGRRDREFDELPATGSLAFAWPLLSVLLIIGGLFLRKRV